MAEKDCALDVMFGFVVFVFLCGRGDCALNEKIVRWMLGGGPEE